VVILTGGIDLFGAGADIQMLSYKTQCRKHFHRGKQRLSILENMGKPTIASIGDCLGVAGVALCCDFRIARTMPIRSAEVKLGVLPDKTKTPVDRGDGPGTVFWETSLAARRPIVWDW
jgi:enoyl-CoA hydratase/carnithine racemase